MYDIHASYGTFSYFSNEYYYFIILITIFVNMDHIILFDSMGLGILCYIFWGIYLKEGMYQYNNGQW